MNMSEMKLLSKSWVNGYMTLIEPLAKLLADYKVHPHVLTISGFVLSLLAANFFRLGFVFYAGVVIVLAGTCDVLDGKLARETNRVSKYGALFDSTIDRYSEVIIFMGLAAFFYQRSSYLHLLIILAIAGSFMVSYTRARAEGLGIQCKVGLMQRTERITYLALGSLLGAIPGTNHIFLVAAIWFIAIFANATAIQRMVYIRKQLREKKV